MMAICTGSITIDGKRKCHGEWPAGQFHEPADDGSGIGTGDDGAFAGTVTIGGNAHRG